MKIISSSLVFKTVSVIVQILLLIGLGFTVISTAVQIVTAFQAGLIYVASVILENVLLIIVFLEVYLSALDFFRGKGRSVVYVIDAMISFVSREIIIEILAPPFNYTDLLTLGSLIVAGSLARYVISRKGKKRLGQRQLTRKKAR
ncbi:MULTISPECIES: phosphate-starvation-inducible PsiE family protein [Metallosphaera]|uniref:Membrane protein n=2 Tax=Metallosphaera TaxID=41980 RepID=A0A0K1SIZ1_9CREN|nr:MULTISPECIES: phosphate-starvation-inducible PsiE family protein [Metallosphaera]AKV74586.1 membrane protein [Metallosphaera sedula]AKV76825.1 membrane protein [Metallosphaera sedula]AKV79076.1 membrane protein [Metallosphaera sedula]AKV81321.1 membrane protein [Metallosphaera sedula]AKV84346.1 membrane protein [Metallosphaera sedula]